MHPRWRGSPIAKRRRLPLKPRTDDRETLTTADFAEPDELLEMLIELRNDPPDGLTCVDLPSLFDLAHGDPQLLAPLEVRLEIVQVRSGMKGES